MSAPGGSEDLPARIDPHRSACVLIGVDDYSGLDPLRGVTHNLKELKAALTDKDIWGIPEDRIFTVTNPAAPGDLVNPIYEAGPLADDTLIVYYAGHGLLDRHDEKLLLTLPGTVEDQSFTSVRIHDVRQAIRDTGDARRRVLILDCCYSGRALTQMAGSDRGEQGGRAAVKTLREVEGSYVMASTPGDRPSYAPDPTRCTVFTGALVDVLRNGMPGGPDMLGLHTLFQAVTACITAMRPEMPKPRDEDQNGVGGLDFVRNVAVLPPLTPPPPGGEQPHRGRGRTLMWSLAAATAGLAVGLGMPTAVDWWHTMRPAPAAGECGTPPTGPGEPRTVLLDHSDALDKADVDYQDVQGLSALALASERPTGVQAYALADNAPGLVFPLSLGTPFDLNPVADTPRTLRRADGHPFPKDKIDGEGMVLGPDGRTVLVASEDGPALRRFDLASGKQIGADLRIPKSLRHWPEGSAQTGRTIESLALSPDGRHLYAGWEAPLAKDGDLRGRPAIRIQRYTAKPDGSYTPDEQYAYRAGDGMNLVELVALDDNGGLLALEREYTAGLGTTIRVVQLSLDGARDVSGTDSLFGVPADQLVADTPVLDLATCPDGGPGAVATPGSNPHTPLLDNVEGMAVGKKWTSGEYEGWRPLYLISDDNGSRDQITRLYSLAVRLKP